MASATKDDYMFLTDKEALKKAKEFLTVRGIPDHAGNSDCLAKLLQQVFQDGAEFICKHVSKSGL